MADNNRYTSSSLYSANPRQVGQRPPDEEGEDTGQRQGEPGPSQGSPQQPQQQQQPQGARTNAGFLRGLNARMTPTHSGSKSKEKARLALAKQHRTKKYEQIEKREKQRREKKERKNKELQEKKAKARQTTEENERRRKEGEVKALRDNADEHARVNEAFFRRLEAGMTPPQSETSVSQSPELLQLLEMYPKKTPSQLQEMLEKTNNDVWEVIDLLS